MLSCEVDDTFCAIHGPSDAEALVTLAVSLCGSREGAEQLDVKSFKMPSFLLPSERSLPGFIFRGRSALRQRKDRVSRTYSCKASLGQHGRETSRQQPSREALQADSNSPSQRDAGAITPNLLGQPFEATRHPDAAHSHSHEQSGWPAGQSKESFSQSVPSPKVPQPQGARLSSAAAAGGTVLLGVTFVIALFRSIRKYANPKAKRQRTVNKNKFVVESLDEYLPERRQELTPRLLRGLAKKTGFKPEEVFRKYLWYLLRERKFDHAAVEDILYLKATLGLNELQAADAIKERAQRVYNKYGTVMLNTAGMTAGGVERKATARALFSKLLYLAENEQLITPGSPAAEKASIREVFGATEEDVDKLRIVSLYEVDLDKLEGQFDAED